MDQYQSSSAANAGSGNSLGNQAQRWFSQGNMSQMLGQLPTSLKNVGNQTVTGFNKLSTTQKVLGGALLVLGASYLTRRGKNGRAKAGTLNELLYFVNDRIEGYKRAVEESKDPQLRSYYQQLVTQSQQFANQLNAYLSQEGGSRQTSTTAKGKLYRAWMDAKAAITGYDESAILNSNIYGEEWALKAYEDALHDNTLTGVIRQTVERQYTQSQKTYNELKNLRNKQ
jgi:uncharacterized protein (TIGR02284 family)